MSSARTRSACCDCSGSDSSSGNLGSSDTSAGDDSTATTSDCCAKDASTDPRGHSKSRTEH